MFDEIDTDDDRRIGREEFEAAIPKLIEWGLDMDDVDDKWDECSTNIENFGGDKDRVTIFGESSGSWAVSYLQMTPYASGMSSSLMIGELCRIMTSNWSIVLNTD